MRSALKAVRAATNATLEFVRSRKWPTGGPDISGADLYDLLRTVPGVGETTALTWLAEVTDPRRFDHPKQVAAYCGCDPSLKVSAGKVTTHVRRAGNERLHQALLYAASGLLRRTGDPIGQWGRSIAGRHKKGGHRKACGAVARRIAAGLWHVHRKAEPFSYAQYYLSSKLLVPDVPLKTFLPPRLVRLLHATGIKSTPDLATAYNEGRLATIFGLGAGSIQTIKTWLHANAIRTGPDGAPAPRPAKPHQSQGKAYPLSPALQFKPKRAAKGQPNGNQTTETSRAKARSGSGTTAGSAAAAPARPTHPKHP
jgi:hypothetical protein